MAESRYLNPTELVTKYPDVEAKFNWSKREVGMFVRCKLVDGYFDRRRRTSLIKESSFVDLIKHANSLIDGQKFII